MRRGIYILTLHLIQVTIAFPAGLGIFDSGICGPDTVVLYPGFFQWDENTVIVTGDQLSGETFRYQDILDHSNADFSDSPKSVIQLDVVPEIAGAKEFVIEVQQDTIRVTAIQKDQMETALACLFEMKKAAERKSPDYGLIYIRCGLFVRGY